MAPLIAGGAAPARLVELVVRALALPGATPEDLSTSARRQGSLAAAAEAAVEEGRRWMGKAGRDRWEGWVSRVLALLDDTSIRTLVVGRPGYPDGLLALDAPPPLLFAIGDASLLEEPMVAVVGTRRCSDEGRRTTERIAGGLSAAGVVVVSGLALGIDGVAHRAASARRTIAVLGSGVDVPYPRSHTRLYEAIAREGLLLSERLPGTPPFPRLFPERNRIIAGLSRAVVVVEAPYGSGAIITADNALALGRPVFAVPGSLGSKLYEGSNMLIRDRNATLATGPREILAKVGIEVPADLEDRPPPELEGVGLALWRAVGTGVRHADELADAVGLEPGQSLASLLALEVQGHVRQLPGMRFLRARTTAPAAG